LLQLHVFFRCVCFSFSVLSQDIAWKERLQNGQSYFVSGGT